jgi:hypothetical protein
MVDFYGRCGNVLFVFFGERFGYFPLGIVIVVFNKRLGESLAIVE